MDPRAVSLDEFLASRGLSAESVIVKIHSSTTATIAVKPRIRLLEPKQGVLNEKANPGNILQARQSCQN